MPFALQDLSMKRCLMVDLWKSEVLVFEPCRILCQSFTYGRRVLTRKDSFEHLGLWFPATQMGLVPCFGVLKMQVRIVTCRIVPLKLVYQGLLEHSCHLLGSHLQGVFGSGQRQPDCFGQENPVFSCDWTILHHHLHKHKGLRGGLTPKHSAESWTNCNLPCLT